MIPEHNFSMDMRSCLIAALPGDFFNRTETGSILMKKCPRFSFYNDGVLIDGESKPIQADIVILATGFRGTQKLKNIFTSQDFSDFIAVSPDSRIGLYRECIQPRIPQLAIIGFSESFSNLFTSEIRCRWLVELLDGKFKLPSIKEMEKDISSWDECMKKSSGEYYKRSCTTGLDIWISSLLVVVDRPGLIGLASRIGYGCFVNVGSAVAVCINSLKLGALELPAFHKLNIFHKEKEEYLVVFKINFEESGKRETVLVLFLFQVLISLIIDSENRIGLCLICQKLAKNRTISTQDQKSKEKPDQKAVLSE
nr:probable flavin-containing monooxygenase 1 [Tanacetum cinerariifolium]